MRSSNFFTPFCPDVPFTQLPDLIKPRRNVSEAEKILQDAHATVMRVLELALLSVIVVSITLAIAAQVHP